jgi:hypothetical protein
MAYDDDGSKLHFRDFEDFAIVLERFLAAPENLTAVRVIALTQAIHVITAGRSPGHVGLEELAYGLRQRGLGNVPFDTVIRIAEVVGQIHAEKDALAHVTLRDLQRILQHN